jgi:hypothetical protein
VERGLSDNAMVIAQKSDLGPPPCWSPETRGKFSTADAKPLRDLGRDRAKVHRGEAGNRFFVMQIELV